MGRNYLTPAACCEAVYTGSITDLIACHASAESALPARFLGTTRNIENVRTSCFFAPSVSWVSIRSKVEKKKVAVRCYLFCVFLVRPFQLFFMQLRSALRL